MSHISHFALSPKLAAIALLAAACVLGGCGRKGNLELPPNAAAQSSNGLLDVEGGELSDGTRQDYGAAGAAATAQGNVFAPTPGGRGKSVVAPPGPKKRIILDPILD